MVSAERKALDIETKHRLHSPGDYEFLRRGRPDPINVITVATSLLRTAEADQVFSLKSVGRSLSPLYIWHQRLIIPMLSYLSLRKPLEMSVDTGLSVRIIKRRREEFSKKFPTPWRHKWNDAMTEGWQIYQQNPETFRRLRSQLAGSCGWWLFFVSQINPSSTLWTQKNWPNSGRAIDL